MQSRAAASGLKLVAKAKAGKPAAKPKVTVPTISPEEEARQRRAKQLEHEAQERKAAEAAAKEKVAQRQWILQYAEDDSESEPDEDDTKVSQKYSPLQTWDTLKRKCTYTTEYRCVQYLTFHSLQVLCRNSHLHTLQ